MRCAHPLPPVGSAVRAAENLLHCRWKLIVKSRQQCLSHAVQPRQQRLLRERLLAALLHLWATRLAVGSLQQPRIPLVGLLQQSLHLTMPAMSFSSATTGAHGPPPATSASAAAAASSSRTSSSRLWVTATWRAVSATAAVRLAS